jgi:hypothetical protein
MWSEKLITMGIANHVRTELASAGSSWTSVVGEFVEAQP